jgi:DNA repair exonuclease SbcCD ATPase subunit
MLDNDSESDIDDGDHNDVEKSSLSRSGDLQRKVSIGSSSQRSSIAHDKKCSSDVTKGGKKMDTQRLEKKYKRIKKQLLAAKETVAKTYEESNQHMKLQLKYQDMKKSYREMERKYVDQLFQTTGYEREVRQLKENLEKLQQETKSLKKKILMNSNEFDKEKERLKNIAESIKVGNMQEMKLIIEQNKQLKRQNLEIVQNLKTMSMEKNEVDKLNARLKMKLNEGKKDCLMNQSDDIKSKKATSKSKMVELFRESIKEAEDNHRREQEEEILLKRQMDRKNMIRKSSTQTSRVLAAVTLQKRLKLKLAPKPSNTVSTIKSKEKAQHVGGVRKRPASQDLRHLFVKKR